MASSRAMVAALASLGPARIVASSGESTGLLTFSRAPAGAAIAEPDQCLTASDGGLVLAECDGGAAQQFLLRDSHFLVHGEECLEVSGTSARFATCDQDSSGQWFSLGKHGYGPILNCFCEQWGECPMSCAGASGVAEGSNSAYLAIGSEPLSFFTSSAALWTPAPSEEPSTSIQAPAPPDTSAAPAVAPSPDCSGPWQKCGGEGWTGPTCCAEGFQCEVVNQWHSQCNEAGAPAPSEEPSTSTQAPAPPDTSDAPAVAPSPDCPGPWQKCGGEGWAGPTCCVEGFQCEEVNQWHSQCNEAGRRLAAEAAPLASPVLV